MVDVRNHLAAYGWVDGNPVHFLTSADGTATTMVNRRIGKQTQKVRAPIGIRRYNANMHAVDRHDQLRDTFSLAKRHGFKKYYHKIAMGLLDMVVVNAWIHYKLVHKELCKKRSARRDFMISLAESLLKTDWLSHTASDAAKENEKLFRSLFNAEGENTTARDDGNSWDDLDLPSNLDTDSVLPTDAYCQPVSINDFLQLRRTKKRGFSCQVCSFEGRGKQKIRNVVICMRHRLRLCTQTHKEDDTETTTADRSWRATGGSCWQKAHSYYIPNGLFTNNVLPMTANEIEEGIQNGKQLKFQCVRTGCNLYKQKHLAFGTTARNLGGRKEKNGNNTSASNKKTGRRAASKEQQQDAPNEEESQTSDSVADMPAGGSGDDTNNESGREESLPPTPIGETNPTRNGTAAPIRRGEEGWI
jgi:hypothetical protein